MEDIQLDRFHSVQIAFEHIQRNEVPAHINHQPAPGKARRVLNVNHGHGKTGGSCLHQLQKHLQAMQRAQRRGSAQRCPGCRHVQRVRFIFAKFRDFFAGVFHMNDQRCNWVIYDFQAQQRHAGLTPQVIEKPFGRALQNWVASTGDCN